MTALERLQVIARQLTSDAHIDFDPAVMYRALIHDNYELRQAIYEFICKVRYRLLPCVVMKIHQLVGCPCLASRPDAQWILLCS